MEVLSLYNIILLSDDKFLYGFKKDLREQLRAFCRGFFITRPTRLSNVEQEDLCLSLGKENSFQYFVYMDEKLVTGGSNHTKLILVMIQNVQKIGDDVSTDQEDVLITDFIEPLIMPYIRRIPGTVVHGNGHPLFESYLRKVATANTHKLSKKKIRGRAPDRTIEYQLSSDKKFSVLIMEIKTTEGSLKKPDFIKLTTLMKDVLDFALKKGVVNYMTTGVLVAGPSCKLYSLHMPINRMYCMHEVSSFQLPTNTSDSLLVDKVQHIMESMLTCHSLVDSSTVSLRWPTEISDTSNIVDSYPSPSHHNLYFK